MSISGAIAEAASGAVPLVGSPDRVKWHWRRDRDATIPRIHAAQAVPYRQRERCDQQTPLSFVAIGDADDRRPFIAAIRAFALAKRLGDCLTIVGYGQHRRRLEKWTTALGIAHIVTFADETQLATHDVAVILACRADRAAPLLRTLMAGLRVVAYDCNPAAAQLLADGRLGALIPAGDRLALAHGMITAPRTDRATVLDKLAPYIIGGVPDTAVTAFARQRLTG